MRSETGRSNKNSCSIRYQFYRNLMYILYGIINSEDTLCGYEDFTNEQAIQTYDNAPVARINVKKQAGGSSIDNNTLKTYIERDKEFLIEQISALDADVLATAPLKSYFPPIDTVDWSVTKSLSSTVTPAFSFKNAYRFSNCFSLPCVLPRLVGSRKHITVPSRLNKSW